MPTINKLKKVTRKTENSEKRKERQRFYNSVKWRKLRLIKLADKPLCERCESNNIITPAEDVHHVVSFMSGNTDDDKKILFFDINNLESLCKKCHQQIHQINASN